jgi:hypothetical protein
MSCTVGRLHGRFRSGGRVVADGQSEFRDRLTVWERSRPRRRRPSNSIATRGPLPDDSGRHEHRHARHRLHGELGPQARRSMCSPPRRTSTQRDLCSAPGHRGEAPARRSSACARLRRDRRVCPTSGRKGRASCRLRRCPTRRMVAAVSARSRSTACSTIGGSQSPLYRVAGRARSSYARRVGDAGPLGVVICTPAQ